MPERERLRFSDPSEWPSTLTSRSNPRIDGSDDAITAHSGHEPLRSTIQGVTKCKAERPQQVENNAIGRSKNNLGAGVNGLVAKGKRTGAVGALHPSPTGEDRVHTLIVDLSSPGTHIKKNGVAGTLRRKVSESDRCGEAAQEDNSLHCASEGLAVRKLRRLSLNVSRFPTCRSESAEVRLTRALQPLISIESTSYMRASRASA
jgi:hypothetical protein